MVDVPFPVEAVALRDLAERNGLGFADVMALADISSSKRSRSIRFLRATSSGHC
jgi:hypothetical protein